MSEKNYKVISITVDKELHEKVRPILKDKRISLGSLLDAAIKDYLKKIEKEKKCDT